MNKSRTKLLDLVTHIAPHDEAERRVVAETRQWIESGAALYRGGQPDEPSRHMVSYVVLVDRRREKVLLVDHVKAGLWLPTGGHVEPDEDPAATAARELAEELGPAAATAATIAATPLFITASTTRGAHPHVDVSLWYVVWGREEMPLSPDPREFRAWRWWRFGEVLATDAERLDPEMKRFVAKLQLALAA